MASGSVPSDPLAGLVGPALFPNTFRASIYREFPPDCKDLDSFYDFMKSVELQNAEKFIEEAEKVMNGGAGNVAIVSDKDRAKERRPGLGRARKKGSFSLKATLSQPTVSLEPSLNIDQLQDPDAYFDAYERLERAKKEIQKQVCGNVDSLNQCSPSIKPRQRRPSILGKSYKHQYSLAPSQNDDMLMSSQETEEQGIPSAHKDEAQGKLMDPDPNPHVDLEEAEADVPMKKTENEVNDILEELLSCNAEDLDEGGALNLVQERLKIKPLDLENLSMPQLYGVGGTSSFSPGDSLLQSRKSSLLKDSVLKHINRKSRVENNQGPQNSVNTVSSPTPPRSPFASLSLLQKKVFRSNPQRDPFSPLDVDLSASNSGSPLQFINKLQEQADAPANLSMSSELKSRAVVEIKEPDMNIKKLGSHQHQFVDESIQRTNVDNRPNEVPNDNVEGTMNFDNLNVAKSSSSINFDAHNVVGTEGSFPDQFVDENTSIQGAIAADNSVEINTGRLNCTKRPSSIIIDFEKVVGSENNLADKFGEEKAGIQQDNADNMPVEPTNYVTEERMNLENLNTNQSNPSVLEDEAMEDPSSRQFDEQQQHQVHQTKLRKKGRKAGEKRKRKANSMGKSVSDILEDELKDDPLIRQDVGPECEREATDVPFTRIRADPRQSRKVNQPTPKRGKRAQPGEKHIKKAHPMRKSIAESGTTFETGVRRSRRVRMRPLEYWKGERFLYGRMDESIKLIGVQYISPGKGDGYLKLKPYLSTESSGYKKCIKL